MIDRIIAICIRKRLVIAIMLTLFGYYSWT